MTPTISVVIPVYNGERFLAQAIQSALAQDLPPIEIIVVDDGSSDASPQVAGRFAGVQLLRQERAGAGAARNTGLLAARGEFLAFLDADDLWLPHKLSRQAAALTAAQGAPPPELCFTLVDEFIDPQAAPANLRPPGLGMPGLIPSSLLVRRQIFLAVGLFDPEYRLAEFFAWYSQALQAGLKACMLPEALVRRRLHGANSNLQAQDRRLDFVRAARQAIQNRRSSP
jgi:glycosyltransferase involved in cell wall biosynthesis